LVAEPTMVAYLLDHDMAHAIGAVLPGFAPVTEDRPAIDKDRIDPGLRIADALLRQRDTAIEAHQVERAVEPHRPLGLAVGKILDPDQHIAQMALEAARQRGERALRQRLEIGERGRQLRHRATRHRLYAAGPA